MANLFNPIPVTTVSDNNYPRPQLNADGQWVVSASAVNQKENKVVLYNPISLVVYPVTPYTVSLDYLEQVRDYEKTLAQIQAQALAQVQGYSDTTDVHKINSLADVALAGSEDTSLVRMFSDALPKLLDGDFKGAAKEVWEHSPINEMVDKLSASGEFIKNTLIDPITSTRFVEKNGQQVEVPDTISSKGLKLLNNTLVNLGETMDYITQANTIKGAVQGLLDGGIDQATANMQAANGDPYGSGHKQFDWNLKPTGTAWDTVLNIGLEVLSDPTTYITFGTGAAIKAIGKDAFADVLRKSADDIGSTVIKEYADDLADVALRTFLYKDTNIANALRTAKLKNLDVVLTPEMSSKFFNSVTKYVGAMSEAKTLNVLKSVRGASDTAQSVAMKAVGISSSLGLGYGVVKAGVASAKIGIEGTSYIAAKINNLVKDSNLDKATFKNINESVAKIEQKLDTMSDLFAMTETDKMEVLRRATKTFQDTKYNELQRILNSGATANKTYNALNEWAVKEGYENIEVFLENARLRTDLIPEEIVSMVQEIEYTIDRTIRSLRADTLSRFADALDPAKVIKYSASEFRNILKHFDRLYKIPDVINNIDRATLDSVRETLTHRGNWAEAVTAKYNFDLYQMYDAAQYPVLFDFASLNGMDEYDDMMWYIRDTLADPKANQFMKDNAKNMLKTLESDQYYKVLYDTGMSMDKAENVTNTIDAILASHVLDSTTPVTPDDLKFIKELLQKWNIDPYSVTEDLATKANQTWGRVKEYFEEPAQRLANVNVKELENYTRNKMGDFFILTDRLKKVIPLVEAMPVRGTTLQTMVSGIVSKAVDDVPLALKQALDKKGVSPEMLSEMIVRISGVDLKAVFKTDDTLATLNTFEQIADLLEGMPDLTYFIKEGGLAEDIAEWHSKGFSIELGNDVIDEIDELVYRLNAVDPTSPVIPTVQMFRDEVQELVNWVYQGLEERISVTTKLMEGKLYKVKQSHIGALTQLLSVDGVEDIFTQIRANQGVGALLDALYDVDAGNFTTKAVQHLQSLAKSTYVGQRFINRIAKSKFSAEWKDGIYDTLAGMAQSPRTEIVNVDTFAADILGKAKKFIDNKNNHHPMRWNDLSQTRNVLEESEMLFRHSFMDDDVDQATIEFWKPLYEALTKDKTAFNVTYSAKTTAKNGGNVYQFAYTLPDGTSAAYINRPVYEHMMRNMNDATAYELFGTNATKAKKMMQDNLADLEKRKSVQFFTSEEDMATAMYNAFHGMKQAAKDSSLTPRLIGFNSALDSLGTDKALSDYMYKNLLNTRILYNGAQFNSPLAFETFDAAEFIRIKYDNAIAVTDDMHKEMVAIVSDIKQYLDKANAGEPFVKASVMPNFTRETTASFREMLAVIDNVEEIMSSSKTDRMFKYLSEKQYATLRLSFDYPQLVALRQTITDVLKNLGDSMSSIHSGNQVLGQTLLIQNAMTKLLDEPNVMQILNKYLVSADGVPALSFKTFNDPAVFNAWFDKVPEDILTLGRMYDVAEHMQKQLGRIKHPILVLSEDTNTLQAITQRLHDMFRTAPGVRYSVWNESTIRLNTKGTNQLQNYIVAKQYWDSIVKVVKPDKAIEMEMELWQTFGNTPLLHYITNAEGTVMFNDALYTPHIKVLQSELLDESNKVLNIVKDLDDITSAVNKMETLEDAITLQQYLKDEHGYNLPSFLTKIELTKSYGEFVNGIKTKLNDALKAYIDAVYDATPDIKLLARQEYTKKVEGVLEALNELKGAHAIHRVQTIFNMDAVTYRNFLYKYAQGVQVVHLGSDMFKAANENMQTLLAKFNLMLRDAEGLGIKTVVNPKTDELYIYLDKSAVNLDELQTATKRYVLESGKYTVDNNMFASEYNKLLHTLTDIRPDYGVSMHRAMNIDAYDELVQYLPKEVRDNLIDKDFLDELDMISGNFNHTIIGDYGYGMGSIYSIYSSNLVTNVAAGFNSVYNHIRGKDMYTTLFFNPENKLRTWVDYLKNVGTEPSHQDVRRVLEKKSMVLAKLDGDKVVQVPIATRAQYQAALNDDVMLLDYFSYTRAVEIINDNKINSKTLSFINRNFLSALKVGQLISTGWVFRNIGDSTLKGWTQAGLDPAYMVSMLTKTRKTMARYDYTYAKIFEYTKATMSADKIAEFFRKYNGPDTELLDEATFKKLLTFANSTSSVASPKQLNLYNDLARNLYLKVRGNEAIKQSDVSTAIKIFTENPHPADAKRIIFEKFPEEIATDLMLLKKFVPKKAIEEGWVSKLTTKVPVVKNIMQVNNDFEYFIRLHTFLYHTEYTNGTASEAIRLIDKSQFNRARDTKAEQILEDLLPFSSFQLNNMLYWKDTALAGKNNFVAFAEDVISGSYNSEELDIEELSRNMSLQYLFLTGNLVLNSHDGLNLKTNDSIHSTLALLSNPVGTFSEMFNVPIKVAVEVIQGINANEDIAEYMQYMEEHQGKEPYGVTKPLSMYSKKDKWDLYSQLIPLVGVLYQRYSNGLEKGKLEASDMLLPILMPSIFGVTKLDSAGTTYESRPIGTDWYNRDEEYKKTHKYVFGISYIPSWMSKNPLTYANTYERLQQMGFTAEQAGEMMQNGWYMKAPDYILRHYEPYSGNRYQKRYYAKRYYAKRYYGRKLYPKKTYPTKSVLPRKPKKFAMKSSKPVIITPDRMKVTRGYRVRRVYRTQLYSNRYTRTGVSRETLINWRGANRSSRQLLRDRSNASRLRAQRVARQVKPS